MDPAKERFRLEQFPTVVHDPSGTEGGVLLTDEIRKLCGPEFRMIEPFDESMLRAASYRLRVGPEYRKGTQVLELRTGPDTEKIEIKPGEMVIVQTLETLNLPREIIARWNMKTDLVYRGLLWVGGPQVDPGWLGHLQCPIYNLSNDPVTLRLGEPFAIMDFQRTTRFTEDPSICVAYQRPPRTVSMEEYQYGTLTSSTEGAVSAVRVQLDLGLKSMKDLSNEIDGSIDGLRDEVRSTVQEQARERTDLRDVSTNLRSEVDLLRNSVFVVMTVFVAAVGALATAVAVFVARSGPYFEPSWFLPTAIVVLFGSAAASAYAATRTSQFLNKLRELEKRLGRATEGKSNG